jgi:phosphatidylserine/phosphatidylglycerophosphate/cardiolipin synthase-like enzyme
MCLQHRIFHVYFIISILSVCWSAEKPIVELVESIPAETSLDIEQIANTTDVWLAMISSATQSLDIETSFMNSKKNHRIENIFAEIMSTAKRGVKVRILCDATFYKRYSTTLDTLAKQPNILTRKIDWKSIAGGHLGGTFFVVDHDDTFLGSQNFDWKSIDQNHELGIRIKDHLLGLAFTNLFNQDWTLAKVPTIPKNDQYFLPLSLESSNRIIKLLPVFCPPPLIPYTNLWMEPEIINLINNANSSIQIQLLSYSTFTENKEYYTKIDESIRKAAARNIKIKILCSDRSKKHPMIDALKSLVVLPNIDIKLNTLPELSNGFAPPFRVEKSNYLLVDGENFWIGSASWSNSHFYKNREIGIVVQDSILSGKINTFFENNWQSPYSYFLDPSYEYPLPRFYNTEE